MDIAPRLENYLTRTHTHYHLIHHPHSNTAYDSARLARLPSFSVVKGVMLQDQSDDQYFIAALPSDHKLNLPRVCSLLHRKLTLAEENASHRLFPDCICGAIPGFAQAYGIELIWDEELKMMTNLFFEAGNHEDLIHINHKQFMALFEQHPYGTISSIQAYSAAYH